MDSETPQPWQVAGARAAAHVYRPRLFVEQHIFPLFVQKTRKVAVSKHRIIRTEPDFWKPELPVFGSVTLEAFKLCDWFPRAPGVFWSRYGQEARREVYQQPPERNPKLGTYYRPESKAGLIEGGGMGTIRLRPRKIDNVDCWLATAVAGEDCHAGIPLALPDSLLYDAGIAWGETADITGRVRFLQDARDAQLDELAQAIHHTQPLIVFVEQIEPRKKRTEPIVISPVVLFDRRYEGYESYETQYTFVQCLAGRDAEIDSAVTWIETYVAQYSGRIVTNFDEKQPILANAPLSYQRLVSKTFERSLVTQYIGDVHIERLNTLIHQESTTTQYLGETHVGHNINVSGPAIIAIDSTLNNVSQTIAAAPGLNDKQKSDLDQLVQTLKAQLEPLKATHADEAKEIADAVEKAVANVSKPAPERKPSMLQLSAKGLTEAANLVKDIAPTVLTTAGLIAKFIVGI